jgi:hypothetical protein
VRGPWFAWKAFLRQALHADPACCTRRMRCSLLGSGGGATLWATSRECGSRW